MSNEVARLRQQLKKYEHEQDVPENHCEKSSPAGSPPHTASRTAVTASPSGLAPLSQLTESLLPAALDQDKEIRNFTKPDPEKDPQQQNGHKSSSSGSPDDSMDGKKGSSEHYTKCDLNLSRSQGREIGVMKDFDQGGHVGIAGLVTS